VFNNVYINIKDFSSGLGYNISITTSSLHHENHQDKQLPEKTRSVGYQSLQTD
jgi:hypothetical protein